MPQPPPKPLPHDPENPYVLVPLHLYPEFMSECATLLNTEWPRSQQARLNSLRSCSNNFPVGMVLVQSNLRQPVGFCKVSLIPNVKNACFVESVIVHPEKRGKGLGSLLMRKLEDYIISRQTHIVYLSTMGQEKFYSKLGYSECQPVSLYAFGLRSNCTTQHENGTENLETASCKTMLHNNSSDLKEEKKCLVMAAPPPPPPPPKLPLINSVTRAKTYMKKELSKMEV